jgi:hypothetical protein
MAALQQQEQAGELTDAQLDQVAGGYIAEFVNAVAEEIGRQTYLAALANWARAYTAGL